MVIFASLMFVREKEIVEMGQCSSHCQKTDHLQRKILLHPLVEQLKVHDRWTRDIENQQIGQE